MSYEDIDNFILDLAQPTAVPVGPSSVSFVALKKLAEAGVPGVYASTFAAPVEDVRAGLAQAITYEFQKEASTSLEYLLGELRSLSPQGFTLPNPIEKTAGIHGRVALEQQSLLAMEKLCHLVGDGSPIIHTLRHFVKMSSAQLTELRALAPSRKKKTAGARLIKRAALGVSQVRVRSHEFDDDERREKQISKTASLVKMARRIKKAAPEEQGAPGGPIVVPPPNSDSPEAYVARERQQALDQSIQELAHTKMQANQTVQMMQEQQQAGQQAQEQLGQAQQQAEQTQGMLDQANQASQAHQQQAVEAETRAAQHATQKMQLGMRVQQMRQELAAIATQDPVSETASNVNDLAAQGAPATPDQMAQAEQEQAVAEQGAQQPPAGPGEAEEEAQQAERAAGEAEQQAGQAEQAAGGAAAAPAAGPGGAAAAPAGGMAAA